MAQDHLDRETSVSVQLTESGVKAGAKSRFIAAVDRFGGNLVELANAPLERRVSRQRVVGVGEQKIAEAAIDQAVARLGVDEAYAERIFTNLFSKAVRAQDNKDATLRYALEDMRHSTSEPESGGPSEPAPEFMDRMEIYAEGASTEELREKWGRVLSSEIQKPGTFSPKALRVVDELDSATARAFEELCVHRLADVLPRCLTGEVPFSTLTQHSTADLLLDPGIGHIRQFRAMKDGQGHDLWLVSFGFAALAFARDGSPITSDPSNLKNAIVNSGGEPAVPVYILTDVGRAIASIFPDGQSAAFASFLTAVRALMPSREIREFEIAPTGAQFVLVRVHPATSGSDPGA